MSELRDKVVVIAGCGDVGCRVGLGLNRLGATAIGVRRNIAAVPKGLVSVQADVVSGEGLDKLPSADAVVYCVAADARTEPAYRAAYVDGPRRLREFFGATVPFLFVSSTSVFGQVDGQWIDEGTPAAPSTFTGKLILEGERGLEILGWPLCVVRFGGIYGPGRRRLIDSVKTARPVVADPPQYTNRIHVEDCASVLIHLLQLRSPDPLYLAVDDEPAPAHVIRDWMADALGVTPPKREVFTLDALRVGSKRLSNGRLKRSGYMFQYPTFREGYGELLGL
ncbi:MAG: SDR family NAD(P)-dependent oxidoreductase [Chromatiales bacterium]|nr:SDR family NAD(P)-dependent oxidoreductase [Chromatiales bacterium]